MDTPGLDSYVGGRETYLGAARLEAFARTEAQRQMTELLGSIAEEVVRKSPCPVVTVRVR